MKKILGIGDKFYLHQEDKDDTVYEIADVCIGLSDESGNYETYIVCIDGETLPIFMVLSLLRDGEMYIRKDNRIVAEKLRQIRKRQAEERFNQASRRLVESAKDGTVDSAIDTLRVLRGEGPVPVEERLQTKLGTKEN